MIYQLHWQFKSGKTEMRAQKVINNQDELKVWENEVMKSHPLPEGATWMVCTEKSKHFVMVEDKDV